MSCTDARLSGKPLFKLSLRHLNLHYTLKVHYDAPHMTVAPKRSFGKRVHGRRAGWPKHRSKKGSQLKAVHTAHHQREGGRRTSGPTDCDFTHWWFCCLFCRAVVDHEADLALLHYMYVLNRWLVVTALLFVSVFSVYLKSAPLFSLLLSVFCSCRRVGSLV